MAIKVLPSKRRHVNVIERRTGHVIAPNPAPVALETRRVIECLNPLLSVLVPTIAGREAKLQSLLNVLTPQCSARSDIELVTMRDGRTLTIGRKRNLLITQARGQYIAFVDDDDMVSNDYVEQIVAGLATKPDVLCFIVRVEGYGPPKPCRYGLGLVDVDCGHEYHRRPNHLMVWRCDLAKATPFPDIRRGEDTMWAQSISQKATTEVSLDATLYTYRYDPNDNSATARRSR